MYTPKHFRQPDADEVKRFIRDYGFGILVSHAGGALAATHIPLELSEDGSRLHGHISKGNAQWKQFSGGGEVLAIFQGPHAYISSSWYDHENVPTWNYIAAHVYGTISIVEGERVYQALKRLVDKYEKKSEHPITVEGMSPDYVEREMKALVGFEIAITRIEASYKLSQNRDAKNYGNIIHALEKQNHPEPQAVADAMKKHNPHTLNNPS